MENGRKFSWRKNRQAQIEVARYFGYVADLNFILAYSFFLFFNRPDSAKTLNALNMVAANYFNAWRPVLQKDPR